MKCSFYYACLLAGLLTVPGKAQYPDQFRHPRVQRLRYEETFPRDSLNRKAFLLRIKHLPLGRNPRYYLTLGGAARYRYELYRNEALGQQPRDRNGYSLFRTGLFSDWHLGRRLRVFAQLESALIAGRNGGPRPVIDQNQLDVHQLFAEGKLVDHEQFWVSLRLGRQEIDYHTHVLSTREGPNTRLSFDLGKAIGRDGYGLLLAATYG